MQNEIKHCELVVRDCGLVDYRQSLVLQEQLGTKRYEDQICNTVLIMEHPPVITLGARKTENKLLTNTDELIQRGIKVVSVRRGGGITAHNPGQAVLYPIIKLPSLGLDINEYIRDLESIGIELLETFGVTSDRRKNCPGLWVRGKKIASIGVQVKKWVTFHGMAINVNNDLGIFENIVPCGLDGVEMTSVSKEIGREIPMARIKEKLAEICVRHWSGKELVGYGN